MRKEKNKTEDDIEMKIEIVYLFLVHLWKSHKYSAIQPKHQRSDSTDYDSTSYRKRRQIRSCTIAKVRNWRMVP